MKKDEVKVGAVYAVKVSGRVQAVMVTNVCRFGGWYGTNVTTKRDIRIKSAAKLRYELMQSFDKKWRRKPSADAYRRLQPGDAAYEMVQAILKEGRWSCDSVDHNSPKGCSNPVCFQNHSRCEIEGRNCVCRIPASD